MTLRVAAAWLLSIALACAAATALVLATPKPVHGGLANCHPAWKCSTSTPRPSPSSTASTPSAMTAASPTAAPTASGLTFDDEFDGSTLSRVWIRHFSCCGVLAGYDTATVSGGYLHLTATHRSTGWYGTLVDTKTTFTQLYGHFEARIRIPEGAGLWPAWWMYLSGAPEIDTAEICANPLGANAGNDASLLHTTVHWSGGQAGRATRTGDLSQGFHVYAVDWRADHVTFYLDGSAVFTVSSNVPSSALPLVLNLGVGGSWCGSPDASTPSPSSMLVDWVRVLP